MLDSPHTAKLRARIALNRSSLRAVRHHHAAPFADPSITVCRHPPCAMNPAIQETAMHVIAACPMHSVERALLLQRHRLHTVIATLRQRANNPSISDDTFVRIVSNQDLLIFHLTCASPPVMRALSLPLQRCLVGATGAYLAAIAEFRPP